MGLVSGSLKSCLGVQVGRDSKEAAEFGDQEEVLLWHLRAGEGSSQPRGETADGRSDQVDSDSSTARTVQGWATSVEGAGTSGWEGMAGCLEEST